MNAALLVTCGLLLSQVPTDPGSYPELEGTHSVLVKTTTLAGTPAVIGNAPSAMAASDATAPADEPARESAGELTPVPPLGPAESTGLTNAGPVDTTTNPSGPSLPQRPEDTPSGSELARVPAASVNDSAWPPSATFVPSDDLGTRLPERSAVSPATATESPILRSSQQLVRDIMTPSERGGLVGSRIHLQDLLAGNPDRQTQLRIVSAYWQLFAAVARYHHAFDRQDRLARTLQPDHPLDGLRLQTARAAATADLREAELAVVSMQHGLAEMAPQQLLATPILPTDEPFVGEYQTHFESLFSHATAPPGLRRIHHILPLRQAAIDARATAVGTATEASQITESAYDADEASVHELLESSRELRAQREAFVVAVRDYNIDIAAYALAVAGENVVPETLVSMLIANAPRTASVPATRYQTITGPTPAALYQGDPKVPTLAAPPSGTAPQIIATVPPNTAHMPQEISTLPEPTITPAQSPPGPDTVDQSPSSPFRDVTPASSTRPEVLVPTTPARHRTPAVPTELPAPSATLPASLPPTVDG